MSFIPPSHVPPPLNYATPHVDLPIREIGLAQRLIMWVICIVILVTISMVALALQHPDMAEGPLGLALIAVRLATAGFMIYGIYRLATALGKSMTARVLFCIAMIIPYVGLIVLLVLNSEATKKLRANHIRVGLMGAKLTDLPAA